MTDDRLCQDDYEMAIIRTDKEVEIQWGFLDRKPYRERKERQDETTQVNGRNEEEPSGPEAPTHKNTIKLTAKKLIPKENPGKQEIESNQIPPGSSCPPTWSSSESCWASWDRVSLSGSGADSIIGIS
jgi:hypothetical protein